MASIEAVWGWVNTFMINIIQYLIDIAQTKLFLAKFWNILVFDQANNDFTNRDNVSAYLLQNHLLSNDVDPL